MAPQRSYYIQKMINKQAKLNKQRINIKNLQEEIKKASLQIYVVKESTKTALKFYI